MFKRRKHANAMVAVLNMPGGRPGPESPRIAGPEREVRTLVVLNLIGLGKNTALAQCVFDTWFSDVFTNAVAPNW